MTRPHPVVALVSWLLSLANADPPLTRRREFYALKSRLLQRYGRHVGGDWQELTRECYGCDGTGKFRGGHASCRRCGGSGIYDRAWNYLERWEIGGRVFHRFGYRLSRRPDAAITIVGRVEHADHGRACDEAALWLALVYDRPLFRRLMLASCACGPTWRYPLVTVQKLTMRAGMAASHFKRRKCHKCGASFRQGFRAWRQICFYCRCCDRKTTTEPEQSARGWGEDQEIPF